MKSSPDYQSARPLIPQGLSLYPKPIGFGYNTSGFRAYAESMTYEAETSRLP